MTTSAAAAASASATAGAGGGGGSGGPVIRDVWRENLEQEFALLRSLVRGFPVVSVDVEYPGIVARHIPAPTTATTSTSTSTSPAAFLYNNLRSNVDLLSPIQLAFSLSSPQGQLPQVDGQEVAAWQFNFRFSLKEDMFNLDSIKLLERAGVKFEFLAEHGIAHQDFAELLTASGLVFADELTLVCFQGGFTLAYLVKLLSGPLPKTVELFADALKMYVPVFYDLRLAVQRHTQGQWKGGALEQLARDFAVLPSAGAGQQLHTAGADAYLQLRTFWAMMVKPAITQQAQGVLYGLEPKSTGSSTSGTSSVAGSSAAGGVLPPLALNGDAAALRHLKRRGTSDMIGTSSS